MAAGNESGEHKVKARDKVLPGQLAVVTGSDSGIGPATSRDVHIRCVGLRHHGPRRMPDWVAPNRVS